MATQASDASEEYDLVILTDATSSMGIYLKALNTSLPQILALSELTSAFRSIGILAYRDYNDSEIIQWSGWYTPSAGAAATAAEGGSGKVVDLFAFAKSLQAYGGDDFPEAVKTAAWKLVQVLNPGRRTLALWYADAPPHHLNARSWGGQMEKEIKRLRSEETGKPFLDWFSACQQLRENRVQVFTLLDPMIGFYKCFYVVLTRITGGTALLFPKERMSPRDISLATVDLILAFLDHHRENTDPAKEKVQTIAFESVKDFENAKSEAPEDNLGFLPHGKPHKDEPPKKGLKQIPFSQEHVRRRVGKIPNFSERFQTDPEHKSTVYKSLQRLIEQDVTAISLNPVFGELWRAVCKDRLSDERTAVVDAFSNSVGKLPVGKDKNNMNAWLEESYDSSAQIREIIEKVDSGDMYPAVCIDPTESKIGSDHWARSELLEVGRSCYSGVLKRLGAILTKDLVFIEDEASMPAHLRDSKVVPMLPFALAGKKHGQIFWNILLHLVLPGTMLTTRAGNVLAALAIKMGIPFLKEPAREALEAWKGKWKDLDTTENWSVDIMQLLTSADDIGEGKFLDPNEKSLFRNLVDYKFAELNLETELHARIPFTPEKTVGYVGPVEQCSECKYERSVTIMGTGNNKGLCGMCLYKPQSQKEKEWWKEAMHTRAKDKTLPWVECMRPECHAAYVVHNVEALNVGPKCHYCRFPNESGREQTCPWISCNNCKNRIVWPEEYRDGREKEFLCVFCQEEGRESIVVAPTTAKQLLNENPQWILGKDGSEKIGFKGRSIYAVVKEVGVETMQSYLTVLPESERGPEVLKHKPIHNPNEVKAEFARWIKEGEVEAKSCSLCFENKFKPSDVFRACGRRGCPNKIDADCMKEWYGINKPGGLLHFNALHCPFCRRLPNPKILANFSFGIRAVADLQRVINDRQWIYAWCIECSTAKPLMERICEGAGGPPELKDWKCDDCSTKALIPSKKCPGCGIPTEKSGGCNHITCPVGTCKTHWCFACGIAFDKDRIYDHMNRVHGGLYRNEVLNEEDDDSDND